MRKWVTFTTTATTKSKNAKIIRLTCAKSVHFHFLRTWQKYSDCEVDDKHTKWLMLKLLLCCLHSHGCVEWRAFHRHPFYWCMTPLAGRYHPMIRYWNQIHLYRQMLCSQPISVAVDICCWSPNYIHRSAHLIPIALVMYASRKVGYHHCHIQRKHTAPDYCMNLQMQQPSNRAHHSNSNFAIVQLI